MVMLSLLCLIAGATLAALAPKRPVQQAILESTGGCLLILGLALIGAELPVFR